MTKLGKWLVFLNLVLSLVFVAWAVGLVTNQIPWHTPPAGEGIRVQGLVATLQDDIKRLTTARDAADARWVAAYADLQNEETRRPYNERYYVDMLRSVREGGVQGINPPVQRLEFGPNNVLVIPLPARRSGRPAIQIEGQNALPVAGYHKAIRDTVAAIQKAQADEKQLVAATEALTKQVAGTKPPDQAVNAEEKGLRLQLSELNDLAHQLQLEQEYLRSPLTSTTLQLDQLRQRREALTKRLGELRTAASTALGLRP